MIHATAIIGPNVHFGAYVKVWSNAVVGFGCQIGDYVVIGANAYVGNESVIGEGSRLQTGVFLPNGSRLGKRVFLGPNVTAADDKYPRVGNIDYTAEPPIFEDDCSVGAGAVILPGITIGHHAMVGAGSVVSHDVEPYAVVTGLAAKMTRILPQAREGT